MSSSEVVDRKIVKIQDLPPVAGANLENTAEKVDFAADWLRSACRHWGGKCPCKVLASMSNGESNVETYGNALFTAFRRAYDTHQGVALSPDDLWLCITMFFAKYVNQHSEELRSTLVKHAEGKVKLTVTTDTELSETQWGEFFSKMPAAMAAHTQSGVLESLTAKFSSTGPVETTLSTLAVMDAFKTYFSYRRVIPLCGISHVEFLGKREDWLKLREKLVALSKYASKKDDTWPRYVLRKDLGDFTTNCVSELNLGMDAVLEKFLDTYDGKVDVEWWNKVMNITHGRVGSGSTSYITGWVLQLFGLSTKVETNDIPSYRIDVPIEIDNHITRAKKTVRILGGFSGISYANGTFRPHMSMAVCHIIVDGA